MKLPTPGAIGSVAYKEFLHIYRDRRILILLLILPPFFTLIFGHAFEADQLTDVPSLLVNRDDTPRTQRFLDIVTKNKTFVWKKQAPERADEADLLGHHVRGALVGARGVVRPPARDPRAQARGALRAMSNRVFAAYDGFADFPDRMDNLLALINSAFGAAIGHTPAAFVRTCTGAEETDDQ